ncbi:hypothetical protein SAMN05216505_10641 [Streptomyces prasinopilosus]|uniref:Uncharacterized protein n=1 Tax=Streptomyces prasinopilosus TaxID=67344 RepID=A0A1G6T6X4_9ACTN|nr:hypothetical protein SAMN05216505_10641 [Streptomyces prasinopilosus]
MKHRPPWFGADAGALYESRAEERTRQVVGGPVA